MNGWNENNKSLRENIVTYRGSDIICINETHLTGVKKLELEGYTWEGNNRSKQHVKARKGYGGVGIFIKNSLYERYHIAIEFKEYDDMLGILFTDKNSGFCFLVYSLYLPPETSTVFNNAPEFFERILVEVYKRVETDAIYLVGDFNAKLGALADFTDIDDIRPRKVIDLTENNHGKALKEFLIDSKCCTVNGRVTPEFDNYTFVSTRGTSVVDYFITPHDCIDDIVECRVDLVSSIIEDLGIESLISDNCREPDHSLLTIKINTSPFVIESRMLGAKNYTTPSSSIPRYKVRTLPQNFMNSESLCQVLNDLIDEINVTMETQSSVDKMYDKLLNVIHKEMQDKLTPIAKGGRRKNTPYKPYWNSDLSGLWKTAHEKELIYTRFRGRRAIKETLRRDFILARRKFDKLLKKRQRNYRRGVLIEIETVNTTDPRQFWKMLKKLGPNRKNQIPWEVYDENGQINCNKEYVLNKWKNDYNTLYNENNDVYDDRFRDEILNSKAHLERGMQDPLYESNRMLNQPITLDEVKKAVTRAKSGKAMGTDSIPNEVLKNDRIVGALHALFQLCFDSGKVPSLWTQSVINPIPKNKTNDPRVPLNYRGISLLSCIYKIYSAILNNRLTKHLDDNSLIHDEQNGFREGRSCVDHIFTLSSIIRNKIQQKQDIYACYVDFRKAFDFLDREMMLFRFLEFGIDGKFYSVIKGIYHRAQCAVRINGVMTDWFSSTQGTKQGDNLSPNCFSMYLNPLISDLKASGLGICIDQNTIPVLAYADDLVLVSETPDGLQKLIDILYSWCHKWRLSVNIDKTKVMHFREKSAPRTDRVFRYNNLDIECVSEYKYLGVLLNDHMDFTKTANLLANSAGRALGSVINKVKMNKDLGFKSFTTLVDNCVIPILCYGSGVWGQKYYKICEDVILRACRFYSGVHRLSPIPGIQGDFGWLDCKSRWAIESARLFNRFLKMDDSRLNKKVFLYDKSICKENWSSSFKNLLIDLDMENHWTGNRPIPLEIFKKRITERFARDWRHHCSTKDKLRTYRLFKTDIKTASHLNSNLPKYERSLISQLRLGVLPLRIETGRYQNLIEAERICEVCDSNQVENEYHFLFECDLYNNERSIMETAMRANFNELSVTDKFNLVFLHPYSLGRYMAKSFNIRKSKLYKS